VVLVRKTGLLQCFIIYYYIKEMHKALCQLEKSSVSMSSHFLHQWAYIMYFFYIAVSACSFPLAKLIFHYVVKV